MVKEIDGVKQVDVNELKDLMNNKPEDMVVIDIREPDEYDSGHIPGVPLLPMHSVPEMIEGFDKDKEYVFICRSGNRSQNVALYLKDQGFDRVVNYHGGMLEWDTDVNTGIEKQIKDIEELKKLK
ncbi:MULTISPECIES: rhodanese-like domain-containing protein [Alteribacter]|uniref:Rhodanese-like domain-containing protein n=1 Tax=Alteribacter keqinensis TaxID=2483800 RepID=A0A3M7TYU9_9BACI|nr:MULTISPECIES: rhodanese-like domain-containing protein [Alteribacter]MBM7097851.1 rhodanese-like domain-containing protein [Alteribacter salitolerans]RNA70082.1 rhodanese-like domain-containing protein [Alteribacter keqinensis]